MKPTAFFLVPGVLILSVVLGAAEVPSFFGIKPGSTTRAEVELMLGEPLGPPSAESRLLEYPPPTGAGDASRIAVGYFEDTKEVSRLDVYLKTPLAADGLRQEFGRAAIVRERTDGGREEFYYPRYQGIVLAASPEGDRAVAIVFLSPRYLSGLFAARAISFLGKKDYETMRLEADKAVLADPDNAAGYGAQARYYYAVKEYDNAFQPLVKAMNAKYPAASKAEAHTLAGIIQRNHKSSPEAAAREFAQAIAISDSYAPAHFQLGLLLLAQGQKAPAAAEFTKTLAIDARHASARIKLADYFYDAKSYDKALEHYAVLSAWAESEAAAEADTGLRSQLHFRYGYCLLKGINELAPDYDSPIVQFRKAIELNPAEEINYSNLAYACELKTDWAAAEPAYLKSLSLKPGSLFSNRHLGMVFLEEGRSQAALAQAEKTLGLSPRDPNLMMDIARCYAALKKKGQAKDWIRKAVLAGYQAGKGAWDLDPYFGAVFKGDELDKLLEKRQ